MSGKYYAIIKGRNPGIYRSWEEAKAQAHGFSGAIYKSFKTETEAKAYFDLQETPKIQESSIESNELHVYTDGSHQRERNYLGIGAWCRYQNIEFSLSKICSSEYLKTYGIS